MTVILNDASPFNNFYCGEHFGSMYSILKIYHQKNSIIQQMCRILSRFNLSVIKTMIHKMTSMKSILDLLWCLFLVYWVMIYISYNPPFFGIQVNEFWQTYMVMQLPPQLRQRTSSSSRKFPSSPFGDNSFSLLQPLYIPLQPLSTENMISVLLVLPLIECHVNNWASLVAQMVKRLHAMWETWVQSLGWEEPLEKEMASHSSTSAWKIPGRLEPIS